MVLGKLRRNVDLAVLFLLFVFGTRTSVNCHQSKDFDDAVIYKIDFEVPDFEKNPELKNQVKAFYTHDHEKYDCVIPVVDNRIEEKQISEPELSPFALLQPIFLKPSCSYRIEAYWSYEICHGLHVRQYHEEREGKNVKSQEYYLGKWNDVKTEQLISVWEEERKAGIKYKTTKIDNTKYPYVELKMTDGTVCDIINAPRTTVVRYVCYPHGKNEILSFKETSSCNYEAIILTSVLCVIPAFHPEELEEVSIKCFNSPTPADTHKPLSMLRHELSELEISEEDFLLSNEALAAADISSAERYWLLNRFGNDIHELVLDLMRSGTAVDVSAQSQQSIMAPIRPPSMPFESINPLRNFVSGDNCLTGGSGWWKYEFCYGRHVRQFHKDKKGEIELFLGYFTESAHRQWIGTHPDKIGRGTGNSPSIWHHYEKGTRCDRTGLLREVDVKLSCVQTSTSSSSSVSMYLLEPKTCQYILVVESALVCELVKYADEFGLVHIDKLPSSHQKPTSSTGDLGTDGDKTLQNEYSDSAEATRTNIDNNVNV